MWLQGEGGLEAASDSSIGDCGAHPAVLPLVRKQTAAAGPAPDTPGTGGYAARDRTVRTETTPRGVDSETTEQPGSLPALVDFHNLLFR